MVPAARLMYREKLKLILASIQLQGENTEEWKLETPIDEFFKCVVKVVKEELIIGKDS
jgi:hypothetical protein